MKYKDFSRVPSWKRDLVRKIGLFGLSDLRRLSPIGDLGYANGWYWNTDGCSGWMYGDMEKAVVHAFGCQGFRFDKCWDTGYRRTDHHYYCSELGLSYSVDSSD